MFNIFEKRESVVRSYCRNFPILFKQARNAELYAEDGSRYIDFFAGAGALNYGHNNPFIKSKIVEYLQEDNIIHALDMYTVAKQSFLTTIDERILKPRNLDYKVMFCGPTGTNAIEAALKLARKNKQRTNIFAFSGCFHGMSMGALAMTTEAYARKGAGVSLSNVSHMPYSNSLSSPQQALDFLEFAITNDHSGFDKPAAIFLETTQAEGGINVAPVEWLCGVREICDKYDILLVVDDIQVGIGRTGYFFSFERAGIVPDMVVLSKSISGFGLPMALLLMKEELDIFGPAEHNGTFRGNQLSFIGSAAGLEYFIGNKLDEQVRHKGEIIKNFLETEIQPIDNRLKIRGIGMIWGIDFSEVGNISKEVMLACVRHHLIIERAGCQDCVVKIMPPLTISEDILFEGLEILKNAILAKLICRI